jgi:hypothetical protein
MRRMNVLLAITLAQMPWTVNLPRNGLAIDILRPKFSAGETSLISIAAFISGRIPMGEAALRFELPIARGSTDFTGSSMTLGNPYIGVETGGETGFALEAGIRGPLASESEFATQIGAFSDITRFEAFVPDAASLAIRPRYRVQNANGFTFDGGGGPSFIFPTSGGGDPEIILHHHMMAGYRGEEVWASIGFGGWTFITQDAGGVGERTLNEVGASFGFAKGSVRPAVHVLVPIDDEYNALVGIVLGFGVSIPLK